MYEHEHVCFIHVYTCTQWRALFSNIMYLFLCIGKSVFCNHLTLSFRFRYTWIKKKKKPCSLYILFTLYSYYSAAMLETGSNFIVGTSFHLYNGNDTQQYVPPPTTSSFNVQALHTQYSI